jgi:hypothetical protein
MKPESLVFGVAGMFLGLIAGWLIGSQQPSTRATATPAPQAAAVPAQVERHDGDAGLLQGLGHAVPVRVRALEHVHEHHGRGRLAFRLVDRR